MRVLACGGRTFEDRSWVFAELDRLHHLYTICVVIDGDAGGVDRLGGEWATEWGVSSEKFPADWIRHGRRAGLIRNQQMLDEGKPDLVVAFPGGQRHSRHGPSGKTGRGARQ